MKRDFALLAGVIVLCLWVIYIVLWVIPEYCPRGCQ